MYRADIFIQEDICSIVFFILKLRKYKWFQKVTKLLKL